LNERVIEARQHFPNYQGADCLIVIGMESELSSPQTTSLNRANAGRHNIRIVGFDWLKKRAATIVGNVSSGEIEVIRAYRVV
jgi:hypothetical protein